MTAAGGPATLPGTRARLARARPLVLIGLAVVAAGILLGLLFGGGGRTGRLDPESASPAGSRALAELLRDQGVTIVAARSLDEAERSVEPDTTLLVTDPDLVPPGRLPGLLDRATAAVLVRPTNLALEAARLPLRQTGSVGVDGREPGCALPAAVAAGSVDAGGVTYEPTDSDGRSCYLAAGAPTLVQVETERSIVTVVGAAPMFTNDRLDELGNAALAMRLLGGQPRLVWYLPSVSDTSGSSSLVDVIPAGWKWGAVQLAIAAALLALWRARRLGPVVTEPLPVVVRAAEAVEGRARIYHRVKATDRAGETLRAATRSRLRRRLGLSRTAERAALVDRTVHHASRPPSTVDDLLYGAAPADESALVRLAEQLDELEREVRRQ